MLLSAWDWLVLHNLWQSVVGWAVFSLLTAATAWFPWRRHKAMVAEISENLDTSTPGGLTDVVKSIDAMREEMSGSEDNR